MKLGKSLSVLAAVLTAGYMLPEAGPGGFVIGQAEARVGHPATPASGAGVARRTTRRVLRRGAYRATLPAHCTYGTYYGYKLYSCGGTYYQRSGSGYVVVYF